MRGGVALLVLLAVRTAPAAAQWRIGFELNSTHYHGSSRDTAGSNGPSSFQPANGTTFGLRLDRTLGRARVALHASYGKVGLMGTGPELTLIDNSTGRVFESQALVSFRVVGIGSSGAIRAEVGPSLHLWKAGDQTRQRLGAVAAAAYEWPIADRVSGAIRLEGIMSKSWFDPGDVPPEYERRATWRYSVGLGLRYRL